MNVITIVSEHRSHHGAKPVFRSAPVQQPGAASKPFIPFPPGTVRGPYICGKGNDPKGGVQFLVQTVNGWVPFIEARPDEAKCEKRAKDFAATLPAI